MSAYQVQLMPRARKDLDALSGPLLSKLEQTILGFYNEPRPRTTKKLAGAESKWRVRVGEYRILYEIDDAKRLVKIYRISHRREAYR